MPVRTPALPGLSALSAVGRLSPHRRWQSSTAPPGEVPQRQGPAVVGIGTYADGRRVDAPTDPAGALQAARRTPGGFTWVGLLEPTAEEMAVIAGEFGLHPVAVEDAVHAHQRPKLERYGDVLFMVVKTAVYVGDHHNVGVGEVVETGEIMVFAGPDLVVTVRHGAACSLEGVRRDLEGDPERLARGPMAVLHAVVDRVVDDYDGVADAIGSDIDELEDIVFATVRGTDVQRVYQLKRELVEFARAVQPLARPLEQLAGDGERVPPEVVTYFRDVEDHVQRVSERIGSADDLVVNLLNATLTQLALRQNDDMRKMSAWLAIVAVPTMLAGIYGMNFEHMPELHWRYGYAIVLAVMGTACSWLWVRFRRSGWL